MTVPLQSVLILASAATFAVSCQIIPDSYLDEVFHIPQTQQYCAGNYDVWDDKITTPPGLYYLGLAYVRILSLFTTSPTCTVKALRSFSLVGQLSVLPIVLSLFPVGHHHLPSRTVTLLQLFPTLYFFSFLYYTDVWSTIFALSSIGLSIRATQASWFSVPLKIAVGTLAVAIRQTNIIWVTYALAMEVLTVFVYPDEKGKDRADDTWFMAANARLEDVRSPADFVNAIAGAVVRVWRGLRGPTKGPKALKIVCSYAPILGGFAAFVVINGGITLGDKNNHVAGIHIPQIFYFATFTCALAIPSILSILSQTLNILFFRPFTFAVVSGMIILAIRTTTIAHPFVLADNRHYIFYLWRRVLNATPWSRYIFAPGYAIAMYIVFARAVRKDKILTALVYFGACAAVLVPSPLIECRYFIVPYLLWRIRVATLKAEDDDERRENKIAEYVEIVWYAIINAATIALFLGYSFEWPSEPGVKQRFMW
ncbi:alpha-2-glucosyltransferase Alg10 [Lipomyces tetrasporus]|uniref:Dol-P-Glc:Glc(2)Man(9)GlcNAc(2)-PP-Dol alpha-1,2-glucosyltransferase n=1 Tax=Lipomyces tetrasporus TaxID=54092 RepID=A0AAD7VQS7_9ASCO|nr:alpha-2-glucosyltransferase Alg10 [Lipomyces tetrasporus]KAJ8099232.1 alpha-2-glucosyltransferase Alg10 [Lipomyces tetrasporus]